MQQATSSDPLTELEHRERKPGEDLLTNLSEQELNQLTDLLLKPGWEILRRIFEEHQVSLLSKNASDPNEAFAKVKIEEGFGQALDLISRISSRKGTNHEDALGQERGRKEFVHSRARHPGRGKEAGGDESYRSDLARSPNGY
jgi:hypothetical protein